MGILISIFSFIIVFLIVALTHEIGHFIFAKRVGIKVLEFGIGFGPNLFKKEFDGTIYSINLIPILAFVKLAGIDDEDNKSTEIPKENLYTSKSPFQKFLSIASGPIMNILLGFVIFSILAMTFGLPYTSNIVSKIVENSPAQKAGLKVGDKIIKIDGEKIIEMELAINKIHKSAGKEVRLTVLRGDKVIEIKAIPEYNQKLKVGLLGFLVENKLQKYGFFDGIIAGASRTIKLSILIVDVVIKLFTGRMSLSYIAGPIGIAKFSGQAAMQGMYSFLNLIALITINLGIFNLLPIPALDGGRLVFVLIEAVRKKPIDIETENKIHQWGLTILLLLFVVVSINDIKRFIFK